MWRRKTPGSPAASTGSPTAMSAIDEEQLNDDDHKGQRIRKSVCRMLRSTKSEIPLSDITVVCATWNVGESHPVVNMESWLRAGCDAGRNPHIIAVSLQEVDMSVKALANEQSNKGAVWLQNIHQQLGGPEAYTPMNPTQVVGLMLLIFVRTDINSQVRHVSSDVIRQGKHGLIGNKGCIGLRLSIRGRSICIVAAHFVPNIEGWGRRNALYNQLVQELVFEVAENDDALFSLQCMSELNPIPEQTKKKIQTMGHDYVIILGDLNYRIDNLSESEVRTAITEKNYAKLLENDQLCISIKRGEAFKGFCEAPIDFDPTYKYEEGTDTYAQSASDGKGKKRIPAWCDRVVLHMKPEHDNRKTFVAYNRFEDALSDHRPVAACIRLGVWSLTPTQSVKLIEDNSKEAELVEDSEWHRRWVKRYLGPAHESLVTSEELSADFKMQEIPEYDLHWREGRTYSRISPTSPSAFDTDVTSSYSH